jgi:hypothetical protein
MDEQTIENLERAAKFMKTWSAILQRRQQTYWRDLGMIEDGGAAGLNDDGRPKWTSMSFPTKEADALIDGLQKLADGLMSVVEDNRPAPAPTNPALPQ